MKATHSYDPLMQMTVREAFDKLANEWKYKTTVVNGMQTSLHEWECFSGDPKIRHITADMLNGFEVALAKRGLKPNTAYRYAAEVRRIVARVKQGDRWVSRKPKKEPVPTKYNGTLRSFFHVQYKPMRLLGKSQGTFNNYEIAFRHFARLLGRPARLKDLTNANVAALMQMIVDHGSTNRTANKQRDMLCAIWRFANNEGLVRKGPTIMAMTEPKHSPLAWTKPELRRVWEACASQTGTVSGCPAGIWWATLYSMLWNSAERIGAVTQLQWSDVDLVEGFVHFRAETRKGRSADNMAKLKQVTIDLLQKFPRHDPGALVFAWPGCRSSLWTAYRSILKGAGLPHGRRSSFHRLRKSAATWFEIAGGNATDLLMHSSRQITKSYLDPRLIGKVHGADLLFDPAGTGNGNGRRSPRSAKAD